MKRRLYDVEERQLLADAPCVRRASPAGQPGRHFTHARLSHVATPTLRISHFPDPSRDSLGRLPRRVLTQTRAMRTAVVLMITTLQPMTDAYSSICAPSS